MDSLRGSNTTSSSIVSIAKLEDMKEILKLARKAVPNFKNRELKFFNDYFEHDWVGIIRLEQIVGFIVIRHLKRKSYTSVYEMGVDENFRGRGFGRQLIEWVKHTSPWKELRVVCESDNLEALRFYEHLGFKKVDTFKNKRDMENWRLQCTF